jgi:hypothetical protein
VSPTTVTGLVAAQSIPVAPPFDEVHVASYPVTALPPSFAGAMKATSMLAAPFARAVAVTPDGASGTSYGAIAADAADSDDQPAAFWAAAVQV